MAKFHFLLTVETDRFQADDVDRLLTSHLQEMIDRMRAKFWLMRVSAGGGESVAEFATLDPVDGVDVTKSGHPALPRKYEPAALIPRGKILSFDIPDVVVVACMAAAAVAVVWSLLK